MVGCLLGVVVGVFVVWLLYGCVWLLSVVVLVLLWWLWSLCVVVPLWWLLNSIAQHQQAHQPGQCLEVIGVVSEGGVVAARADTGLVFGVL